MPAQLTRADVRGTGGQVLIVRLNWAGRTWYFSDYPDLVPSDLPDVAYHADLDYTQDLTLMTQDPQTKEVSAVFRFPPTIDVQNEILGRQRDLVHRHADVFLHIPGRTWADSQHIVAGRLQDPKFNATGTVATTISEVPYDDRGVFPPESARVTVETWPDHDEAIRGKYYVYPFGAPGIYTDGHGDEAYCTGSPGLLVDTVFRYLQIAPMKVDAETVYVIKQDATTGAVAKSFTVATTTDGLGRVVSIVQLDASAGGGNVPVEEGAQYWIRWTDGGGIPSIAGRALRGVGEIVSWMLRQSTLRVDYAAWEAVGEVLDRYVVAGYIDDTVRPWDVAVDLLRLVPVSVSSGPGGIRPILFSPSATVRDAVAHLSEGPSLQIVSDPQYEVPDPISEIRLEYAYDPASGGFLRTKTFSGLPPDGNESKDLGRNAYIQNAYANYARRDGAIPEVENLQTKWIASTITADQYFAWRTWAICSARIDLEWAGHAEHGWLQPGALVTLTSTTYPALSGRLAIITAAEWEGAQYIMRTTLIQDATTTKDTG